MTAIIVIIVICLICSMAFLCLALLAGADACLSDEEREADDLEQERIIREWAEEKRKRSDQK